MNTKTILTVLAFQLITFMSCFATKQPPLDCGVSRQLAIWRAQTIANIAYELDFSIPSDTGAPVVGNVVISFDYSGKDDVLLDFQASSSMLPKYIMVNGRQQPMVYADEHIIIKKKYLRKNGNKVLIEGFTPNDKTLNRQADYLYTLFVPDHARSVFPCFDQPDLEAVFCLSLTVPQHWKAISNGTVRHQSLFKPLEQRPKVKPTMLTRYVFEPTDLLPTYLFSFVAGEFLKAERVCNGLPVEILYRPQQPEKEQQLDTVFSQIALSLHWLEQYTGIGYPFKKYGAVVLPGYQFGGMEHPGAIHLNERRIFLGNNPTVDEQMSRLNLIAHETAHIWFGDLVTMKWFDDVWTKEVFANFMADKIAREVFPEINHKLSFIKTHYPTALSTDRTPGTHPIQQPLENLNKAGLLYGNIIYHKAPIIMKKLEHLMGEDLMQQGLQAYLNAHSFGNASWDDLIANLAAATPCADIEEFSRVWVKKAGLPTFVYYDELTSRQVDELTSRQVDELAGGRVDNQTTIFITETDPTNQNLHWQQTMKWGTISQEGLNTVPMTIDCHDVDFRNTNSQTISCSNQSVIVPNIDGEGYGCFLLRDSDVGALLLLWSQMQENERLAVLMTLYENCLTHIENASTYFLWFYSGLMGERNELIASQCVSYLGSLLSYLNGNERQLAEHLLLRGSEEHLLPAVRLQLTRLLSTAASTPETQQYVTDLWENQTNSQLSERDYTDMSYRLLQLLPERYDEIFKKQLSRITNEDLRREFAFVAEACSPTPEARQAMFEKLLNKDYRRVEPWAAKALSLLNSCIYEPTNNIYLVPALDALEEIQQTGDIFFPADWLRSLLSSHRSSEANAIVNQWIEQHPSLSAPLMNKLKEAAFYINPTHK